MSERSSFLSGISWFQVVASALAAVTAAWIASSLGVAGTLIGAALASLVATVSSAFYSRTLDKGKTLIVQTTSGTVIQKPVEDGEITQALHEAAEIDGSAVRGAEVIDTPARRLQWKTILASTVVVLAVALAAMGTYELVTQKSFGADADNPRIGNPFGGGSGKADQPSDDETSPTPKPSTSTSTPTPTPATTTVPEPAPAPTATAPEPTASPAPTATPRPAATRPTPTPSVSPSDTAE